MYEAYEAYDPEVLLLQGIVPSVGTSRRTNRGFSLYLMFALSAVALPNVSPIVPPNKPI
jgi:hypothetical protein